MMRIEIWLIALSTLFHPGFGLTQESKLVLKTTFPDPQSEYPGDYLVHPLDMVLADTVCFVVDHYDHSIKEFRVDGRLVRTLATEGKGPGEILAPRSVAMDSGNHRIYCYDSGNSRISCFSMRGGYEKSFRTSNRIYDLAYNNGYLYAASYNRKTKSLFTSYNEKGEIKSTFGSFLDLGIANLEYKEFLFSQLDLKFHNDSLYVFFWYLPVIYVYDVDGQFVRSIKINIDYLQHLYEHNLNPKKVILVAGRDYKFEYVFKGASIEEDYLFFYVPQMQEMVVTNFQGNPVDRIPIESKDRTSDDLFWLQRIYIDRLHDKFYFIAFSDGVIEVYEEQRP